MPVEFAVALGAVFVSVALLAGLAASAILSKQSAAQRRLDAILPSRARTEVLLQGPLTSERDPKLARWSRLLPKSAQDMSGLEQRLAAAGIKSPLAAVAFGGAEIALPVLAVVGVFSFLGLSDRAGWVAALFAGALGYIAPGFVLDSMIGARRKQIRNGLPDLLDLLIVCLEAGSSLDQAVIKASEELGIAYPALAEELRILSTETRAGMARLEAFRNLAQRTRVEDVRALVAMLVQTDRFGTSVAQTLRTMADDMRLKRRQAAEEMAAKVGVKLVFPLVFFLFPALYVVVLGPAVIQFLRNFPD
ncbi:MAG TPA: type II secretion system F family protein [Vicinamibacterales bacterium]|nr:type II secretion system F family protein [Vicinamibacterales bacterium]HPW19183.1 type II secretion system F family protein [Vicinamibacterales bacterium]